MNEFTKEELEDMQSCVRHYTWGDGKKWDEPFYPHLVKKIQSLIDNYCEHSKYIENIVTGWVCEKCGELMDE